MSRYSHLISNAETILECIQERAEHVYCEICKASGVEQDLFATGRGVQLRAEDLPNVIIYSWDGYDEYPTFECPREAFDSNEGLHAHLEALREARQKEEAKKAAAQRAREEANEKAELAYLNYLKSKYEGKVECTPTSDNS